MGTTTSICSGGCTSPSMQAAVAKRQTEYSNSYHDLCKKIQKSIRLTQIEGSQSLFLSSISQQLL